jgi:hypothetical protein
MNRGDFQELAYTRLREAKVLLDNEAMMGPIIYLVMLLSVR